MPQVAEAYLRAREAGDERLTAFNKAAAVVARLGRPREEMEHTTRLLLDWARENHREWFREA